MQQASGQHPRIIPTACVSSSGLNNVYDRLGFSRGQLSISVNILLLVRTSAYTNAIHTVRLGA